MNISRNYNTNKHTSTQCIANPPIRNLLILHQLTKDKLNKCKVIKRNELFNEKIINEYYNNNEILNRLRRSENKKNKKSKSQISVSHINRSIIVYESTECQRLNDEMKLKNDRRKRNDDEKSFSKADFVNTKTFKGNSLWGLSKLRLIKEKSKIRHNDSLSYSSMLIDERHKFDKSLIVNSVSRKYKPKKKELISKLSKDNDILPLIKHN